MSEQQLDLIEIDKRLAEDLNGTELKLLTDRLIAGKGRVVQALDRGVSSEEYDRLTLLSHAYDSGIDALPKLWASIHQDT